MIDDAQRFDRLTAVIDQLLREIASLRVRAAAQDEELQRVGRVIDLCEQCALQTSEGLSAVMGMLWRIQTRLDLLTERPPVVH